jgi:uncharacterized membrane protein
MSLAPLLNAAPAIPLHAFAAMAAFALGIVQFAAPKGNAAAQDRRLDLGWPDGGGRGQFVLDPSDQIAGNLEPDPSAVDLYVERAADRGVEGAASPGRRPSSHLIAIFAGALVVAGLFTLAPGRIMR